MEMYFKTMLPGEVDAAVVGDVIKFLLHGKVDAAVVGDELQIRAS